MVPRSLLLSSATLAFTATAAFADLSAQEVWMDWKAYIEGFGYSVKATESTSGNRLTVSDLTLAIPLPDESATMTLDMAAMSFATGANGTVDIILPEAFPVGFTLVSGGKTEVAGTLQYDTTDLSIRVSGAPESITYTTTAKALDMRLSHLAIEGQPTDLGTLSLDMAGLTGVTHMKRGALREVAQSFALDRLGYTVDIQPPQSRSSAPERFKMTGALDALRFDGTGAYPEAADGAGAGADSTGAQDVSALLSSGFAFDGGFAYTNGKSAVQITENNETTSAASSSRSGRLNVAMSKAGLHYGGEALGLTSSLTHSQMPFPLDVTADKSAFALTLPLTASEAAQDYGLTIELRNLATSDQLWSLLDPTAQLPRAPATLRLDLSGTAKLLVDLLDPDSMAALEAGAQSPGEIRSVSLNALELSAAGASLTGTGAFTIDNTDTQTFAGAPKPVGAVDLKLVGANSLIDKLVAMGLLPEDQAMGARMMMALFTLPSDAPDTLTSKIEVNDQGHVLANGQRLR